MKLFALSLAGILALLLLASCAGPSGPEAPPPEYPLGYGMRSYGDQSEYPSFVEVRADFIPEAVSASPVKVSFLPLLTKEGPDRAMGSVLCSEFLKQHQRAYKGNLLPFAGTSLIEGSDETLHFDIDQDAVIELGRRAKADFVVVCRVVGFEAEFVDVRSIQALSIEVPYYPGDFRCRGYVKASVSIFEVKREEMIVLRNVNTYFDVDSEKETPKESQEETKLLVLARELGVRSKDFLKEFTSPYRIAKVIHNGDRVMVRLPEGATLQKRARLSVEYRSIREGPSGERELSRRTNGIFELERQEGQEAWFRIYSRSSSKYGEVRKGQYAFIPKSYFEPSAE